MQQPGLNDPLTIIVTAIIFLVVLIVGGIFSGKLKLPFKIKKFNQISVSQTKNMMKNKNVILIDIRKGKDYQDAHIKGAISVDNEMLLNFIKQTDKSSSIICYCYKGISSQGACQKLIQSGFHNVYNLQGGFDAWRQSST